MEGTPKVVPSARPTLADVTSVTALEMRFRRIEQIQVNFDRTLKWVEQAVMPGRILAQPYARLSVVQEVEVRLNTSIDSLRRDMLDKRRVDDDVATDLHQRITYISQQLHDCKSSKEEIIDSLQDEVERLQKSLTALKHGFGLACASSDQLDDEMPTGRMKRRADPPDEAAAKRPCGQGQACSMAARRYLFGELLKWISDNEERTRSLFDIRDHNGEPILGFYAGKLSILAKKWTREFPEDETAVSVADAFCSGVPVVRVMMDVFGTTCTLAYKRSGKPGVYKLHVPDARSFFKDVVERERQPPAVEGAGGSLEQAIIINEEH